jgi:hypothetical protein
LTYKILFDEVMLHQLKKAGKDRGVRDILSKMMDRIEESGPSAGKCIDYKLFLYEVKAKHPPLRLYFRYNPDDTINLFEFEMKTSEKKQDRTIAKLRKKIRNLNLFSNRLFQTLYSVRFRGVVCRGKYSAMCLIPLSSFGILLWEYILFHSYVYGWFSSIDIYRWYDA